MKNDYRPDVPANAQESTQQIAKKIRTARRAGQLLSAALTAATVFAPPVAAISCRQSVGGVEKEAPAPAPVKDVTESVTLFGEQMSLTCPENLMEESKEKINGALDYLEGVLANNAINRNQLISLLSQNDVTITVKNDGSVADCEESGAFAMAVGYQWLQASAADVIEGGMRPIFAKMISANAKPKALGLYGAKKIVRIALGRIQMTRQA
jgi:hypothetical protein